MEERASAALPGLALGFRDLLRRFLDDLLGLAGRFLGFRLHGPDGLLRLRGRLCAFFGDLLGGLLAAAFTVLLARLMARVAVVFAARPAAAVFSAAPLTAATAAVPADFAVVTADDATLLAVLAASCAVSVTVFAALPMALPTASAVRVSAPSPSGSLARSSDMDAPFAPLYFRATGAILSFERDCGVCAVGSHVTSPTTAVVRNACRAY